MSQFNSLIRPFKFKRLFRFIKHFMTAFNVESEFLDLKKTYQLFEYYSLLTNEIIHGGQESKEIYEGMTQNTYLFVQEKWTLLKDIENMAIYFGHKHCIRNAEVKEEAFVRFPFEKVKDRVCFIFQKYQQQPTLLDTLLEQLIFPLMEVVKMYLFLLMKDEKSRVTEELHWVLQIVYQLTKVRGQKWITQYFPHQVKDLYPALSYLAREKDDVSGNWESRYVILLWMGVIVLVPFDLGIIDSGVISIKNQEGDLITDIADLMVCIGQYYLRSLTKMREASALFLSKLFTRPDIQKQGVLKKYIEFALIKLTQFKDNSMQNFFVCGIYDSLCQIFKRVQRNELLPLISKVLEQLKLQRQCKNNSYKKELIMRLLTRIGLTYLKPRVVTWAYRKKKQSLLSNLECLGGKKSRIQTNTSLAIEVKNKNEKNASNQQTDSEIQYYRDVNKDSLEDIIDMLIDGLTEKDTNVREEASKGLGTIAGRLSQDMVLDILDHILNLSPSPQSQHAICLTIAELIRRNLLSPNKLKELYSFMSESLLYEKEEGGYSVGQAVRDAACYMTWSVARGYEQGGYQLGVSLMIAACFDREVGCRRAASAAYQELVGRVGDVPHGIQILTQADYFTLGLQKNAYLNVAIFVASYDDYFKPFVENLCYQKLRHWDLQIKRISACSLSLMCPINPHFIAKQILPSLGEYLESESMSVKLGAIIGLGEVLMGLRGLSHHHQMINEMKDSVFLKSLTQNEKKLIKAGEYMQAFREKYEQDRLLNHLGLIEIPTTQKIISQIKAKILDGKIYKGKAGENFRIYTCRLLECFAICHIDLNEPEIIIFRDFIEDNIKNPQEPILNAAAKCLKAFLETYQDPSRDEKFIKNMISQAKTSTYSKCYTLALSKLNHQAILSHFEDLMVLLEFNTKISKDNNDPEKRKHAIQAIQAMVESLGFSSPALKSEHLTRIFEQILFKTVEDYTMDKRGDIGSIVREQSMITMIEIIKMYTIQKEKTIHLEKNILVKVIGLLLQQLNEKIDRIRLLAGSLLQSFFDQCSSFFENEIPHNKQLFNIFNQENIKGLIKQTESAIDSHLETEVIKMEMKIQETLFQDDSSKYLIYFWNLPHNVYRVTVPLMRLQEYSYYILKGLCTSTGGISESIIKFSLSELSKYITTIFEHHQQDLLMMRLLNENVMRLMKEYYKDERIIVPLYKTLDFILEREEVINWEGLRSIDTEIFYLLDKELNKTKSILKVSAAVGIYVSLLILNNSQTKKPILRSILKILCSDLPKARKLLADKLLLFLMSQEDNAIFNEDQSEGLMNILSENDFLEEKLEMKPIEDEVRRLLDLIE